MTQPLTDLNYALLGLLNRDAATGYDLMQVFRTTPLGGYSASPGAIYPALKKLRGRGLVDVAGEGTSGRGSALAITAEGRRNLVSWVTSPPQAKPGGVFDIGAQMLKFTFAGDVLSATQQQEFLTTFESALRDAVSGLRASLADLAGELRLHDRLAVEAGLKSYEVHLEWCRHARSSLRSNQGKRS